MRDLALGIDLGGTYIKSGVVDRNGQVRFEQRSRTPDTGKFDVLAALAADALRLLGRVAEESPDARVVGLGLGTPGVVTRDGILMAYNIPGWEHVHALEYLTGQLGLPAVVDNDANAFALAESMFGAARGTRSMAAFTLGTGVGGGLIIDGRVYHGHAGCAAELGHLTVEPEGERCTCGRRGCIEAYASAGAIARFAARRVQAGEASSLAAVLSEKGKLTSRDVGAAASAGDALARSVIADAGRRLGLALGLVANTLDPEVFVIGGGGAGLGRLILDPVIEELTNRAYGAGVHVPEVRLAELGYEAGTVGAACLVWSELDHGKHPEIAPRDSAL